jgi:hypothetical protein
VPAQRLAAAGLPAMPAHAALLAGSGLAGGELTGISTV